ncbi:MAG: LysM peptidoglycan-binding domain-containing protein [Bacteroidetes bacterium]|nr:MAG: LysM peptidoglycan-binding domain-containing protein [Bacteroidota bacterium]
MTGKILLKTLLSVFLAVTICFSTVARENDDENNIPPVEETWELAKDDPIVAMLDSLALLTVFRNLERRADTATDAGRFPPGFIPQYDDSVYMARIEQINAYSPIEFVYNAHVRTFINLYANRRRDLTERVMGLAQLYFPLFEEQLDKHDLPLELKYLAVIESALNPVARSRVGATGLWQFMYGTGKMYGLEVNSLVDDRSDIYKSTVAACEHFVDLYKIYNDWNLVLCAYNAGPGNVNRAIRRAGGARDFWAIRHFLPRETQNYVPAFMAVTYVMKHAADHNLFPNPPIYSHFDVDTIKVTQQLSLRTVSQFLDIPLDHLRYLNPSFRQNIIPFNANKPYYLRIPRDYTGLFIANADTIYNHRTPEEIRQEELAAQLRETTVHVVRSGEVLGTIARRYGTTVGEIQRLNNLRGTLIRPGQRLIVRAPARTTTTVASTANTHVVRRGETLGVIASRYRVSVEQLQLWNNISGTIIYAGQNLIVRQPENMPERVENTPAEPEIEKYTGEKTDEEMDEYDGYIWYIVQQGDTLQDILDMHDDITLEELKELNDIQITSPLVPGQRLIIGMED